MKQNRNAFFINISIEFEPNIKPDMDVVSMGAEFYEALDKLFGFAEEDSESDSW